jgi:glutamyl-tRNA reductase
MSLLILGVNHNTAPINVRESVAITDAMLAHELGELVTLNAIQESLIVSTCNRTEVYCVVDNVETGTRSLMSWLSKFHQLEEHEARSYLYTHIDEQAAKHLFRVASGLDSMILGEPQILGQLKQAYQSAVDVGSLNKHLNKLFQQCFHVAKKVRTYTSIGANPVSVASTAVSLAKQIFGDLTQRNALFIGAGETIELAAQHLNSVGIQRLTIANRNANRAQTVAEKYNGYGIGLHYINEVLPDSDIVITATSSTLPILGKGLLEQCIKKRKHKPILIIDLAVPRDVEPECAQLADIYLYSVDDLQQVIQENIQSRQEAATEAESIITDELEEFQVQLRGQNATDIIRDYRQQAEDHKQEALEKAIKTLQQGKSPEEALQLLANTLVNKMLHTPTESLKSASADEQHSLIETAKIILGLNKK